MRYSITLSYAGAGFCGWQRQPSDPSVQECLEDALGKLLGGEVPVIGAGRTDTGVNAIGYVACFDGPEGLAADDFCYKLNAILPRSIVVSRVAPAAPDFHARFDARRREYTYFLHRSKDPFVEAFSWQCGYPDLDFSAMNAAASLLVGTHDFSCFEKLGADNKTSVCTVFEAFWQPYVPSHVSVMGNTDAPGQCEGVIRPGNAGTGVPLRDTDLPFARRGQPHGGVNAYWYFRISADRFLRNMVRAIVGTLIEVGRGKRTLNDFASLILPAETPSAKSKEPRRSLAGESVPGHALFLSKVEY